MGIINRLDPEQRKRKINNEEALLEIESVLRSGTPWRKMRPRKGTCWCIFKRFSKWEELNVFQTIWKELLDLYSNQQLNENQNGSKRFLLIARW